MDIYLKGGLLNWLLDRTLGSPTMAFTLERPRT